MSKRLLSIIICIILCFTLGGCGENKLSFENSSAMEEYIYTGGWTCETTYNDGSIDYHYIVFFDSRCLNLTLTRNSDQTLEDMFTETLNKIENEKDFTFETFHEFAFAVADGSLLPELISDNRFELTIADISLEPENALAKNINNSITYQFAKNDTMVTHGETYYHFENYDELEFAFDSAYDAIKEQKKQAFFDKYPNLATANQVKYSVYDYLGSKFSIAGTAELDDYFNYEYRDLEMVYFCICITPTNGSFSDRWYIYGDRSQHKKLFDQLMEGSISNITLIAEGYYPSALSNQMATLTDYYIG